MQLPIERDVKRFNEIVRGRVRENLRKYMRDDSLIGRKGKDVVSIPVPQIELPSFRFGDNRGGVGQGEGEIGQPLGRKDGQGRGEQGGSNPGQHSIEVEITLEELAEILGEDLELPRIQPKSKKNVLGEKSRYTGARRVGPESLRYTKRTYKSALKRMISMGLYDPDKPCVIPIREDKIYRSWRNYPCPESNAVVFYMMDISGSMDTQKKRLVRLTAFWLDLWIQRHYEDVTTVYIAHDMQAGVVDEETFYHLQEDGGTHISSAYSLMNQLIETKYLPEDWNLYAFHFSDGENFSYDDEVAIKELGIALPKLNLFGYGQVKGSWGYYATGGFFEKLKPIDAENKAIYKIDSDDDIYRAIRMYLGKGL